MGLRGLLPDVITYSAAISACEKGQRPQQALQLLRELQLRGLLPDVITYNATISACEKGQKPQVLLLLHELQLRGLFARRDHLRTVRPFSACEKSQKPQQALQLLQELQLRSLLPD